MNEEELVVRLCREFGYGRVMQIAAEAWAKIDPIGAHTTGGCAVFANEHARDCDARTMYRPCSCKAASIDPTPEGPDV